VIINVIEVLRCFTVERPLQGVTEIATKVGMHKSSVSRILATLEQADIVERDDGSRKFRLGLGLISVAGPLLANLDVRRIALPQMQELSASTGETIALVVWSGHEAVTVEQVPSPRQIKHTNPLGTRYGTALSASVQVFLAEMPHEQAVALVESGLPALPQAGAAAIAAYRQRLLTCAERGYAINYGETSPEEVGVAALIRDHRGEAVAAIVLAAPFYRVPESSLPHIGEACTKTATQISARLGATPA
jgi:DNA-binding IclR family transcriptional regulator